MRFFAAVALFITLLGACPQAIGQAQNGPGLSPSRNLSDLLSTGSAQANVLAVTKRRPTGNDTVDYTVGQSLWVDPNNGVWQMTDLLFNSSRAIWTPFAAAGVDPGAYVSNAVFACGTRREVPGYTGALFDITRPSDLSSLTVNTLASGAPDIAALGAFLSPSFGTGYVTKCYDQSTGTTNHATQSNLALAPKVDMTTVVGTNVPLIFDYTKRSLLLAMGSYSVTWPGSGATVTLSPVPAAYMLQNLVPGMTANCTNVPANDVINSINYSTGALVLANAPTGTPGACTISVPNSGIFLDIPNTMQVPWQSWATIMSVQFPNVSAFITRPFILGVHGADALNNAGTFDGIMTPGNNTNAGVRLYRGGSIGNQGSFGANWSMTPQVIAFSDGGTNGRDFHYQFEGAGADLTTTLNSAPSSTLSGGAIGFNNQLAVAASGDFYFYDAIIAPSTMTVANFALPTAAINTARGWSPQTRRALATDGSSTTAGTGATAPQSWPNQIAAKLNDVLPVRAFDLAKGGTIEVSNLFFSGFAGAMPAADKTLLIFHPGLGNSMQAAGTLTVTATDQATGILTISGSTTNTSFAPGAHVTGNTNLPAGAFLISVDATHVQVDSAHLPTGNVGTVTVANDTGAQAFAATQTYAAAAISSGYKGVMLVGSGMRGTFTGPQLTEFNNAKTFLRELWPTIPGVVGFVDLEADTAFGGDDVGMVVTNVNGSNVTVSALSAYAANTNRVYWAGMPVNLAADTGGQTITNLSGLVLTVSGATTGLSVGSVIHAINPAPWNTYPQFWTSDRQHFTKAGYERQGATFAQYLLDNGLLH